MAEKKMVDVFSDVERETAMTANPAGFAVTELGAEDERIVTLAADMSNTVAEFIAKFPERYIEVGIAETNSVSLAAGLASAGLVPYIYSMSPFGMLKTCEQWRTDVDYNHLPVRLVGRLSGVAMGYFGTSHYAVEDIAIARTMNNTVVLSPADAASCISLMRSTASLEQPVYIRIAEAAEKVYDQAPDYEFGKWPRLRAGGDVTLIGHGMGVGLAAAAAELLFEHDSVEADVFDAAYLRPYDETALLASAEKTGRVLTIEEHSVVGGLGTIVAETVARAGLSVKLDQVALPDQDLEVGVPAELYEFYGLTAANVAQKALNLARR
ncbi:MAG TPA: transketolase C-terminal domain-containing protein [Trebonia sp.]|jgi:transketolase